MTAEVSLPKGAFRGHEKNRIFTLAPDPELTQVGPGTPCGEYLRRFWMPVAMTSQVKDLPLRIRRLGEDLVLFRDKGGRYGLLHLYCSHRNASLEFGVIEEGGIRCCYHGWKYDVDGTLLETPGEPPTSQIRNRVCQGAYPVVELKGLIFAYMGPPETMPDFPMYDTFSIPGDEMVPFMIPSPANWLQVMENAWDPYHTVFLHTIVTRTQFIDAFAVMPVIDFFERPVGEFYTNSRRVNDIVWLRIHDKILPSFTQNGGHFPEPTGSRYFGRCGLSRWIVPVDDTNTMVIAWRHFIEGDDPKGMTDRSQVGYNTVDFYGQTDQRSYEQRQREPGDYDAWCGQGPINVHARENLGFTDLGVAKVRRKLRDAIRKLQQGEAPPQPNQLGKVIPTYGGDTMLRIPKSNVDDRKLVSEVAHKVAAIYVEGDRYAGEERIAFIVDGLKRYEANWA